MQSRSEKNKEIISDIEEEKKIERRKKRIILVLKIALILILVFIAVYFYTKYSSTTGIIVKEKRIINEKIPDNFEGIKIIQFSDLYYGSTIYEDEVKNLVRIINSRKPDIVLFTGNLIDKNYKLKLKEQEKLINELSKIDPTIGKYAVTGRYDKDSFVTIMNQSNFKTLDNEYDLVYEEGTTPILLVGLSSLLQDKRDIDKAYNYFNEETHNSDIFTISMMSETDDLGDILSKYNNDLVVAGNSLNGEVNLFGHSLFTKKGSSKYKDEYYKVGKTKIFVSSGIGSPDLGFRLFARPSINFFRISKN